MNIPFKLSFLLLFMFLVVELVLGVELQEQTIIPDRAASPITIDGVLDEEVWKQPSIEKEFKTFSPNYGEVFPQQTKVWAAYDAKNLYFAFKCYDNEPQKIKTSISQRDKIFRDDYIAVLLDAMGNTQSGYEFYINPSGIQLDTLNSAVSGVDMAPDFVWDSAGKLVAEGYQVEIRIPLESIRFKNSKQVKMRVLFFRQVSRSGVLGAWPAIKPGQTELSFTTPIVYQGLESPLKLEVLPNFTYNLDRQQESAGSWDDDASKNIGIGLKYGITSAITAEATLNPDFSQVESDTFQVEVNQRYPVFYSEKRPFFMEGMDVFDFGIISDGMMISAVHTRHIVDPFWALKLSGAEGKMSFALLAANDRASGRIFTEETYQDKSALFGIARVKYNIGGDNSIGVLYSGRHFVDQHNDTAGIDLKYQLFKKLRATVSYLHSFTKEFAGDPIKNGSGWNFMLEYFTKKLDFIGAFESYDKNFSMASAFQNRIGINKFWFGIGPRIRFKSKKLNWVKLIQPYFRYSKLHDHFTGMDDSSRTLAVNLNFTRQAYVTIQYWDEDEAWANQVFNKKYLYSYGRIQLFKWLHLRAQVNIGEEIYYDPENPFLGNGRALSLDLTIEPGAKLNLGFNYLYSALYKKQVKEKLYSLDIFNLHTTYQFNKYFFLRAILRYNNYQEKLLTDFLASFTLIPGTVVHLGYGSLYLKNQWQDNQWVAGRGDLLRMKDSIFFKASYLWRIK
jgi:hypothetical protein